MNNGYRVLYFGRLNCTFSEKALDYLYLLGCDVTVVMSESRRDKLPIAVHSWTGDFIFSFRSHLILPDVLIRKALIAAVNFHPGPPEYPGSGCVNFALYDQAASYGVTAHIIKRKVDSGNILDVSRFPIHQSDTVGTLLDRTYNYLLGLFYTSVARLVTSELSEVQDFVTNGIDETWNGEARRMSELESLYEVASDVSAVNLEKILRATNTASFKPFVLIHGHKFEYSE
jgi:methionyl-tRNA formyltransferase